MAVDLDARDATIAYEGGTFTATRGLIRTMWPDAQFRWSNPIATTTSGRRKFKFGRRQKSLAKGGKVLNIRLNDGTAWQGRITGDDIDFVNELLVSLLNNVQEVWTERGTVYSAGYATNL